MSHFNRQAIPQFLIQGVVDEMSFEESINILLAFSLIKAEIRVDTFEMHRLVQIATQHWLRSEGYEQVWKERATERVAHQFPEPYGQTRHWPICEDLMSHADEVILYKHSAQDSALNCARIMSDTAWYILERKGDGVLAEQRSAHALQIQRQYLDCDSDIVLSTLNTLAAAQSENCKFKEALGLRESMLEQTLKKGGPEHIDSLSAMHNLAQSHSILGHYEMAEDLLWRVLEARIRLLGPEDPHCLISGRELARVYLNLGKYEQAENLLTNSLEMCTRHYGFENQDTLVAMTQLSDTYLLQHKFKEAEKLILQAIPFLTKIFGRSHWKTLDARRALAEVYYRQRKLDEAKEICLSCLNIAQLQSRSQYGIVSVLSILLGLIHRGQGDFTDALRLLKRVVESEKERHGADHPDTLICVSHLAVCYYDMGDKDHAIRLMTEVLEKQRQVLPANHRSTIDSADWLAGWKSEMRDDEGGQTREVGCDEEEDEDEKEKGFGSEAEGSDEEEDEDQGDEEGEARKKRVRLR